MPSIDISNPGASGAALDAALNARGMPVLLASGTISSPVASLAITLPAGYFHYELRTHGLLDNASESFGNFCVQGSQDGATYLTGGSDYQSLLQYWYDVDVGAGLSLARRFVDSKGQLNFNGQNGATENYSFMYINPGSNSKKPIVYGRTLHNSGTPEAALFDVIMNGATARLQKIKFFNSDSSNIIGGSYVLFGIPAG